MQSQFRSGTAEDHVASGFEIQKGQIFLDVGGADESGRDTGDRSGSVEGRLEPRADAVSAAHGDRPGAAAGTVTRLAEEGRAVFRFRLGCTDEVVLASAGMPEGTCAGQLQPEMTGRELLGLHGRAKEGGNRDARKRQYLCPMANQEQQ